jgi:hypothetical protein
MPEITLVHLQSAWGLVEDLAVAEELELLAEDLALGGWKDGTFRFQWRRGGGDLTAAGLMGKRL